MNKILVTILVALAISQVCVSGHAIGFEEGEVEDGEINPEIDGEISDIAWDCILFSVSELERQYPDLSGWFIDFVRTISNLRQRHAACQELILQSSQTACMAAWSTSVAIEVVRLRNTLLDASDRGAEIWIELSEAFNQCQIDNPVVEPEPEPLPEPALFKNAVKSIMGFRF